jgi:hypothetical protein
MAVREWRDANLQVEEVNEGLMLTQGGDRYLARDWTLCADVIKTVDLAMGAQFPCVIRHRHPKPNKRLADGVQYIGFSRRPEERWVFVIDQYSTKTSPRTEISQVTFEKHYRVVLENAGVEWRQENAGGNNIFVPFRHIQRALAACVPNTVELVEEAIGTREWEARKAEIGLVTEALLETWMIQEWKSLPFGRRLNLVGSQVPANGFIDILASDTETGALVVFELKRGIAGIEVVREQLKRYVESPQIAAMSTGGQVWGAVVARRFANDVLEFVEHSNFPIKLFTFSDAYRNLQLQEFTSKWPVG